MKYYMIFPHNNPKYPTILEITEEHFAEITTGPFPVHSELNEKNEKSFYVDLSDLFVSKDFLAEQN